MGHLNAPLCNEIDYFVGLKVFIFEKLKVLFISWNLNNFIWKQVGIFHNLFEIIIKLHKFRLRTFFIHRIQLSNYVINKFVFFVLFLFPRLFGKFELGSRLSGIDIHLAFIYLIFVCRSFRSFFMRFKLYEWVFWIIEKVFIALFSLFCLKHWLLL